MGLARRHAGVRSFTIVEIMVVLGIILLLVTLVVSVSTSLVKQTERSRTEMAMQLVEAAMLEWQAQAGRPLTFGTMNSPAGAVYDIMEEPPATGRYLNVYVTTLLSQTKECRQILAGIPSEMLREDKTDSPPVDRQIPGTGAIYAPSQKPRSELVDSWENRIAMVFPGRRWRVGDPGRPDEDGTIRTDDENTLGVCENGRPCMISSGPDGLFGWEGNLTAQQRIEAASDNIYLYELLPIIPNN